MQKTTGLVIFCCVVYFSTITPIIVAQVLSDGDCLGYTSFDYFRQSPGGYDPSNEMNGELCASLCSKVWMPFAGVVLKRHCLCAYEQDMSAIESIEKVAIDLCDTSDEYVRYYRGKVIHPIVGLAIKAQREEVTIDEEIAFDLSVNSGEEIEFSVDFGDGSDPTDWGYEMQAKHKYFVPGRYMVVVFARQPQHLMRPTITEVTYIRVIGELHNENVNFKCPKVVEPGDSAFCNLSISSGQRLQLSVDFGDGSPAPFIPLPGNSFKIMIFIQFQNFNKNIHLVDIPTTALGVNVPQEKNSLVLMERMLKPEELLIIPLPDQAFSTFGAIQAVEGFGSAPGDLQVFVSFVVFCRNNTN